MAAQVGVVAVRLTVLMMTPSEAMNARSGSVGWSRTVASPNLSPAASALPVLSTQVVPESVESATLIS